MLSKPHKIIIGHLNSILYAHDDNSIDTNPTLFTAKVLGAHAFSLLGKLAKEQADKPLSEEVEKEVSVMESQYEALLKKTSTLLSNTDLKDSEPKNVETLLTLSSSDKSLIMGKSKRKSSRVFQFRRKLSQISLYDGTDEKQESSQDSKKDKKRKERK